MAPTVAFDREGDKARPACEVGRPAGSWDASRAFGSPPGPYSLPPMPTQVAVYRWASAEAPMPLSETTWTMFELPGVGARYWHNSDGFTVREVDESHDPPRVDLNHDSDWTRAMNDQLPDDYYLDGSRNSDSGSWHFHAVTPAHGGRPVGDGYSESMDEAMQQAIAHATEHYRQSQS
jgi:hypothetical protein